MSDAPLEVPVKLVESIQSGRCVAFVGAGFVMPDVPEWGTLLRALAAEIEAPTTKKEINQWLERAQLSREYEGIAECIKAALGDRFISCMKEKLAPSTRSVATTKRLDFLREVPFRAVLTTNFDGLIEGRSPESAVYTEILDAPRRAWWDGYYWDDSSSRKTPCLKLHGTLDAEDSLVFTTREYRRRLYGDPAYLAFLRVLFATHTILFMGFSFTDAYVNELRSEVLAMLGGHGEGQGRSFAIMRDVPEVARRHFEAHEDLHILSYETGASEDHSGFNRWLEAIRAKASPEVTLGELVRDKRILWVDPERKNNAHGFGVLENRASLTVKNTPDEGLAALRGSAEPYDLVITRFGWRAAGEPSDCERLLAGMRREDLRAPVIVFAGGEHRCENRAVSLRLGALAFTDRWETLFEALEGLFGDGARAR